MSRILPSEYIDRHLRIREAMIRYSIDYLFLLPGTNFLYITGLEFARERHRLLAAIFDSQGELLIFGPVFEKAKMGKGPARAAVHTWTDEVDQYQEIAAQINKRHGSFARIGIEATTNYYHYCALKRCLPAAHFVDCIDATDRIRALKSTAEVACLTEAARRTGERMDKVMSQLVEGMTELDLAAQYGKGAMVQFGLTTSLPNEVGGKRPLGKNDIIVIDAGDRVEGYRSDLTRTFFFGEPSDRMRDVYKVVNDAELAAIEAAKPGEPAETVDIAARRVIERAGMGEYFTHRSGHGLGLDFHEFPICVRGNKELLQPGMTLTAEPGVYLPGQFGVRLEDDILITETGNELISKRGPLFLD